MYHFFISSEGRSNFSRLHKLNSEMRGIVATTLTAQLSSLVTAVSVDGHSLRPDAQVSYPTGYMLRYPKPWILILSG